MNGLEPWKIWAVTAALVCAILGSTAARVRPQPFGETSAWAADMPSLKCAASVSSTSPETTPDQNDTYASYIPHRSFSGNSGGQASSITPLNILLYGAAARPALQAEYNPEPVVDVLQEILGDQDSEAIQIAANDDQPTHNWEMPVFYASNDQVRDDMFADVPEDHWVYAAVPDASQMLTFNLPSSDAYSAALLDLAGTTDARVLDLSLRTMVLNVATNGSDSNGAVNVVNAINGYIVAGNAPTITDGEALNLPQNLAMSGELDEELGDELQVLARTQALQAEAQLELQAAQQQREEAIYRQNIPWSRAKTGVVYTLSRQE